MKRQVIVVGAGLFGCTVGRQLAEKGWHVLIIDKRTHIGGNCYSETDAETGVEYHRYGTHVFHTSDQEVWDFCHRFTRFNSYQHKVQTRFRGEIYPMPIQLATIRKYYGRDFSPAQAKAFIEGEIKRHAVSQPSNLEEKAISLVGPGLYEAFIRGYTIKQWGKHPTELPADIITRLPVRYDEDGGYFSDPHQGIPIDGYTGFITHMTDHPRIDLELGVDYFERGQRWKDAYTIYSGPIDRFFGEVHGRLDWRTMRFEKQNLDCSDFQGAAVINAADEEVAHTRIHEFQHLHPERPSTGKTTIYREYSKITDANDDPYYPVNTARNMELLKRYMKLARSERKVVFGGRLGSFRYLDMDQTIRAALDTASKIE